MIVHAKLYDFLKEHETGIASEGSELRPYVHVPFYAMQDFANALDLNDFAEHGLGAHIYTDTVCIELADVFEMYEHPVAHYAACFKEDDLRTYATLLERDEREWRDAR